MYTLFCLICILQYPRLNVARRYRVAKQFGSSFFRSCEVSILRKLRYKRLCQLKLWSHFLCARLAFVRGYGHVYPVFHTLECLSEKRSTVNAKHGFRRLMLSRRQTAQGEEKGNKTACAPAERLSFRKYVIERPFRFCGRQGSWVNHELLLGIILH